MASAFAPVGQALSVAMGIPSQTTCNVCGDVGPHALVMGKD